MGKKNMIIRVIGFSALWVLGFIALLSIIYQIQDVAAPFIVWNLWQFPILIVGYVLLEIFVDKKAWFIFVRFLPIIGFIVSAILFMPLHFFTITVLSFLF